MSKTIKNLKSGNYEVVDSQGVSITTHFIECLEKEFADLEAKLAESEKKLEEYKKCNCKECMTDYEKNLNQIIDKYLNENIKLKQQLAEKEKEIEYQESMKILAVKNQNQKAIAELEKVKNFLLEKIAEKQSCFDSGNYNDFADGVKTICELMLISIDNQIKSLKGETNE